MKTLRKTLSKFALVLLVLPAIFSACEQVADKGIDEIAAPGFALNKFEQNIIDTYSGQVTGYSYAISVVDKVERFVAGANARIAADGQEAYPSETRQEMFRVTTFVTAFADGNVMDENGKEGKRDV